MALTQRTRKLLISAAVAGGLLATIATFGGCASSPLPPAPTEAQKALLQGSHFRAIVGVEKYKYPVYSERLILDLRATGLFDKVEPLETVAKPDLIARVERPVYGRAVIPVWTILTLGIVPMIVEEEHGHVFSIHRADDPKRSVVVDYRYHGHTTLGWVAALENLSPDRTSENPTETPRFRQGLAAAVASNGEEISKLLSNVKSSN